MDSQQSSQSNQPAAGNPIFPTELSLSALFDIAKMIQKISSIPALPMMLFLRKRIGFRRVKLTYIFIIAAGIYFLGAFLHSFPLMLYGFAVLGVGYYQNWTSWHVLINSVEDHHTYSDGISWFEYLPFADFMYKEERIHRFVDTFAGYTIALVFFIIPPLRSAFWVPLIATMFLTIHSQYAYEYRLNHFLDMNDAQVDSLAQLSITKRKRQNKSGSLRLSDPESFGIPTGIGDDIAEIIQKRERRLYEARRDAAAYDVENEPIVTYPPPVSPPPVPVLVYTAVSEPVAEQTQVSSAPDNLDL